LFDEHFEEQGAVVAAIAERIQLLGGVSIATGADVAEMTLIPRPPKGREEAPVRAGPGRLKATTRTTEPAEESVEGST